MRKVMKLMIALMLGFTINNVIVYAWDCVIPPGVSATPTWIKGNDVRIKISDGCYIHYSFCFRTNSFGQHEIVVSRYWVEDNNWGVDCKHKAKDLDKLKLDYLVKALTISADIFNLGQTKSNDCDETGQPSSDDPVSYFVYKSPCESEPYLDATSDTLITSTCEGAGFCKYEYKFCWMTVNGQAKLVYTRDLVQNSSACPNTHYNVYNNQLVPCYSSDCYPNLSPTLTPVEADLENYPDDTSFYQLNNLDYILD